MFLNEAAVWLLFTFPILLIAVASQQFVKCSMETDVSGGNCSGSSWLNSPWRVFVLFLKKKKKTLLAVICVFISKWILTAEWCLEWTSYANTWADCCKYYSTIHKVSFRRSRLKPDYWLKRALSVLLWVFHLNVKFSCSCCDPDSAGNCRCKDVFLHIQTIIFWSLE